MLPYYPMEYQNKVKHYIALIKEQVKNKGIGYQQLADTLGISLVTVKRQLNGDDLSMSKLLAMCDAAGIDFFSIIQSIEKRKASHTYFTTEQDSAFCVYPHLFHYFVALFQQKKSPQDIQQEWQLSPASTHIYLRKLEQLSLIRLSLRGDISFTITEPLGFGPDSQFVKKELQNALVEISNHVGPKALEDVFVLAKPMILSPELREKMYNDLTEVISRYAELSDRYFIDSEHKTFQTVICDYKVKKSTALSDIVNVSTLG